MTDPELDVYPAPSEAHCGRCDFRAPCLAMHQGRNPAPILAAEYQRRSAIDITRRLGVDSGFHAAEGTRGLRIPPGRTSWD